VNSIAPSLIIFNDHDSDEYRAKTLKKSIMALEPGTAEIVNGIEMILASNYMTGRTLALDGGRHLK
jgi:dihydromonapterin reductase/dihydrofolate reductase